MRVIGLDLSLTATGVALINDNGTSAGVIGSSGHTGETYPQRCERIHNLATAILNHVDDRPADLYVIEAPAYSKSTGSMWDRAGLWWAVTGCLIGSSPNRVAIAPPNVAKKWATGKGNADKTAVAVAIGRLCPDVDIPDDNAADALCLALMGAHALGHRDEPAYRQKALLGAEWPNHITNRLRETT